MSISVFWFLFLFEAQNNKLHSVRSTIDDPLITPRAALHLFLHVYKKKKKRNSNT